MRSWQSRFPPSARAAAISARSSGSTASPAPRWGCWRRSWSQTPGDRASAPGRLGRRAGRAAGWLAQSGGAVGVGAGDALTRRAGGPRALALAHGREHAAGTGRGLQAERRAARLGGGELRQRVECDNGDRGNEQLHGRLRWFLPVERWSPDDVPLAARAEPSWLANCLRVGWNPEQCGLRPQAEAPRWHTPTEAMGSGKLPVAQTSYGCLVSSVQEAMRAADDTCR